MNRSISNNSVKQSTQFKCQKHFYFKLFSLVNIVKWFQVLLCITNNSIKDQSFIYTQLNVKTVLFLTIQFNISIQFSSISPTDRTQLGATTPGQSGSGSDTIEGVRRIPQSSMNNRSLTSKLFCVISRTLIGGVLPLCRDAIGVFCSLSCWVHFLPRTTVCWIFKSCKAMPLLQPS